MFEALEIKDTWGGMGVFVWKRKIKNQRIGNQEIQNPENNSRNMEEERNEIFG